MLTNGLCQNLPDALGSSALRHSQACVGLVGAHRLAQEAAQAAGAAVYLEDQVDGALGGEHHELYLVEPAAEFSGSGGELQLLAEGQPAPEAMG